MMDEVGGDPLALLARAQDQANRVITGIQPAQLSLPTPCELWNVQDVLNHLLAGMRRTRTLISGAQAPVDTATSELQPAAYAAEARATLEAWHRPGALDRTYQLPIGLLPGTAAATLQAMDTVAHSWDLARATGQLNTLDPQLAEITLRLARRLLPVERSAALPFKPVVEVPENAPAYDRLAAYLGRQP